MEFHMGSWICVDMSLYAFIWINKEHIDITVHDIIIDKLGIISYQIHCLQEYINYIINSLII